MSEMTHDQMVERMVASLRARGVTPETVAFDNLAKAALKAIGTDGVREILLGKKERRA